MLTKGIITEIDYNTNTCHLRLPVFEGVNNKTKNDFIATFCIPPGVYNGYVVDDVVFVGFEDNYISSPIVLGKLYLGQQREATTTNNSSIAGNSLSISGKAVLPKDTQLGDMMLTDILSQIKAQDVKIETGKDARVEAILTEIIGAKQTVEDIIGD